MKSCLLIVDYKGDNPSHVFRIVSNEVRANLTHEIHFKILSIPNQVEIFADYLSPFNRFAIDQLEDMIERGSCEQFVLVISRFANNYNYSELEKYIKITQDAHKQLINSKDSWKNFQFYRLIHLYNDQKESKLFYSKIHYKTEGVTPKC